MIDQEKAYARTENHTTAVHGFLFARREVLRTLSFPRYYSINCRRLTEKFVDTFRGSTFPKETDFPPSCYSASLWTFDYAQEKHKDLQTRERTRLLNKEIQLTVSWPS